MSVTNGEAAIGKRGAKSGVATGDSPSDPPATGQVNLLYERTLVHEANRARAARILRVLVVLLIVDAVAVPSLWFAASSYSSDASHRASQLRASLSTFQAMQRKVTDLEPAHSYQTRCRVSRAHFVRWAGLLSTLEMGSGPGGLVSDISLRTSPGCIAVDAKGEARSLGAANALGARLRETPFTRALRLTSIRPAQILDAGAGAVQYNVKGTSKAK